MKNSVGAKQLQKETQVTPIETQLDIEESTGMLCRLERDCVDLRNHRHAMVIGRAAASIMSTARSIICPTSVVIIRLAPKYPVRV